MSAAVPTSKADRTSAKRAGKGQSFFAVLAAIAGSLLLLGGLGFGYLQANSPLGLLSGGNRPIAAATVFVPARAPFSFSLLTKPERLIALQQAIVRPSWREQARSEVAEVQQKLLQSTGLDYTRDIQPWIGEEITYAYTDVDLDQDATNGQQPGYFLAIEIAPDRQRQAQSFLQLFWQQQSLAGHTVQSQQVSGVRVLSSMPTARKSGRLARPGNALSPDRTQNLSAATALVGDQFVMFANDVRVIQRSIRSAQTAQNLAQNLAYRQAVDALPKQRIGLAYLDTTLLSQAVISGQKDRASTKGTPDSAVSSRSTLPGPYAAIGIGINQTGLSANLRVADSALRRRKNAVARRDDESISGAASSNVLPSNTLQYLPADSELAVVGDSLAELESALLAAGVSTDVLPEFLQLGQSLPENPWQQVTTDYALAQIGSGRSARGRGTPLRDWILAVRRGSNTEAILRSQNQAAAKAGYSVVPVPLGNNIVGADQSSSQDVDQNGSEDSHEATAWTRFKVGNQRQTGNGLETELLGLHLQQGEYEIYASSLVAMNSALAAPSSSLLKSSRFLQAMAPLETPNDGYIYIDWPRVAPAIGQMLPAVGAINSAARPLSDHIRAVTATRSGDRINFFIQLQETSS